MNKSFLLEFMEKTAFPKEAQIEINKYADNIIEKCEINFDNAIKFFYENDYNIEKTSSLLDDISQKSDIHIYSVNLVFLIECSIPLREKFIKRAVSEHVFWDTMEDLKYKVNECKTVHNIWGNFVPFWYPIFYSENIVKLGRLEYENYKYHRDIPYEKNGILINKDTPVKNIHIPSSGSLNFDLRLDSYKKAYEFFKDELNGGPLICVCNSWLLYPKNRDILPKISNIINFMDDFDIIDSVESKIFEDSWRVFGTEHNKPIDQLPENTSMQTHIKKWLQNGNKMGSGYGILIFDGEKIINN